VVDKVAVDIEAVLRAADVDDVLIAGVDRDGGVVGALTVQVVDRLGDVVPGGPTVSGLGDVGQEAAGISYGGVYDTGVGGGDGDLDDAIVGGADGKVAGSCPGGPTVRGHVDTVRRRTNRLADGAV